MILGYHLILRAYGTWLPADPRREWKGFVEEWERVLAAQAGRAELMLRREAVNWTGRQAVVMGEGFREVCALWGLRCFACSILPTHVHLVIGWTERGIRRVRDQLKVRGSLAMSGRGVHPFQDVFERDGRRACCWARGGWICFIDTWGYLREAVRYVEGNPGREGKRGQGWGFVVPLS